MHRYELKIQKGICSFAEIRYRSGVIAWFNRYIKNATEDITTEHLLEQLKHLTNFHFDYLDGKKISYREGDLLFKSDREGDVTWLHIFRKDDHDHPTITLVKHW